jgi:hypothetical protein
MSLREQAEELEGEAATWHLLWFLHALPRRDFPAGSGGAFVDGAGFSKTARQRAADLLFANAELNRRADAAFDFVLNWGGEAGGVRVLHASACRGRFTTTEPGRPAWPACCDTRSAAARAMHTAAC